MKYRNMKVSLSLLSLSLSCLWSMPSTALAATYVYDGGGTNVFLNEAANWSGDVAPTTMDNDFVISAIPAGKAAKFGVNLPGNTRSITFDSSAIAMSVFGTATYNYIAFAAGGNVQTILNNSAHMPTFDIQLRQYWIGGSDSSRRVWNAANGDILVNSSVILAGDSAGSAAKTWELTGSKNITFSSVISTSGFSSGASQVSIVKTGTGMLTFKGNSSALAGAVNVEAGTLQVANTAGSALGSGAVTVYSGARLAGNGILSGGVVLQSGANMTPGAMNAAGVSSIGTFTGSSLTWNSDDSTAGMVFQLGGTADQSDKIVLTGAFVKGNGSEFIFDFTGYTFENSIAYTLLTFATTDFLASDFSAIGASGEFSIENNALIFTTAIPEPSVAAIAGASTLLLTILISRRRRKA